MSICKLCKTHGYEGNELRAFRLRGGYVSAHEDCIKNYYHEGFRNGTVEFQSDASEYEEWFGFDSGNCDLCRDSVACLTIEGENIDGMSTLREICFDCLRLLMDWYEENVIRPEVSQMIDEILEEDSEVWQKLANL